MEWVCIREDKSRVQSLRTSAGGCKVALMVFENVEMRGICVKVLKGAIWKEEGK